MADSALKFSSPLLSRSRESTPPRDRLRRLVWKLAVATFILMAIGSATRVMNAGLACPDWPLCYGTLIPTQQMNVQVFLEWIHRLDASLIGLMAIALTGLSWWHRRSVPGWLPWASAGALGLVCFQGLLGGLTVTQLLRFDIVTAHLGTALLFFVTLLIIGVLLLPYGPVTLNPTPVGALPWVGLTAACLVYGQSLSGGLVGSRWALHQCLTLTQLCTVMNSHLLGVVPASLAVLAALVLVWRTPGLSAGLYRLGYLAGVFLLLQIALGVATFRLHLQVELLTITHQAVGAALLGALVCLTVYSFRIRRALQNGDTCWPVESPSSAAAPS